MDIVTTLTIPLIACFYCGIDSKPLLIVAITLIGSLVLSTVCIGLSLLMRGKFQNSEKVKYQIFEAEERL